jgi:carbon monoxide dehydrogenase subunit G
MELTNDFRVALPVEQAWEVLTDLERIAPCMPGAQLQEIEGDEHRGVVKIKVGPITAQYKGQAVFLDRDAANHVAVLRAEGRETRGQGNANATITAALVADGDGTAVSIVTDLTVTGRVAQFGRGVLADVSAKLLDQFVESLERMVLADEPVAAASSDAGASTPASAGTGGDRTAAKTAAAKRPAAKRTSPTATTSAPKPEPAAKASAAVEAESTSPVATRPSVPAATTAEEPSAAKPAVRKIDSPEPEPVNLFDAAGSPVAKRVGPVLAVVALLWLLKKLISRRKP